MDGFKASKFHVSDEGRSGARSLGKCAKEWLVERGGRKRVFHNDAFWGWWNTIESREMCVKLSTLSTGLCGKAGVIPVNSGNFSGENRSDDGKIWRKEGNCGRIMSFFGAKVIPIFHRYMLKTVECLCGYVDD